MALQETKDIYTSIGSLGLEERQFGRLYLNWPREKVPDVPYLERLARFARSALDRGITNRQGELVSRMVGRFLLSPNTVSEVNRSDLLRAGLEAAIPVGGRGNGAVVTMFGFNRSERKPLVSTQQMVEETTSLPPPATLPVDRVAGIRRDGYRLSSEIREDMVDDIVELWGSTFGWDKENILQLQTNLLSQQRVAPNQRSMWFSNLLADGQVVALATAERLSLPRGDGAKIELVESTEWRTRPGWERRGLVAAVVSHLHAQIVDDLRTLGDEFGILAETNFRSSAHQVGAAVGMEVPERNIGDAFVPHVLIQNVAVGDGHEPAGLRDFIVMHLPQEAMDTLYSPSACREILEGGAL